MMTYISAGWRAECENFSITKMTTTTRTTSPIITASEQTPWMLLLRVWDDTMAHARLERPKWCPTCRQDMEWHEQCWWVWCFTKEHFFNLIVCWRKINLGNSFFWWKNQPQTWMMLIISSGLASLNRPRNFVLDVCCQVCIYVSSVAP